MQISDLSRIIKIKSVGRSQAPKGVHYMRPWGQPRCVMFCQLWSIISGEGTITHNGNPQVVGPGNHYLFRAGDLYEVTQNPDKPLLNTFIILAVEEDGDRILSELPDCIDAYTRDVGATIITLILDLFWEAYQDELRVGNSSDQPVGNAQLVTPNPTIIHASDIDPVHQAVANANTYFSAFLYEVFRCFERGENSSISGMAGHHRRVIDAAVTRIQHEPGSIKNVAQLASECGYSLDHFSRIFKGVTGVSPQQCLIDSRINTAQHWLDDSDLSVKEIAAELGYSNAQFFARQFRQMVGMAPVAYRKRSKASEY